MFCFCCPAESLNAFDDILVGSFAQFIELSKQIDSALVGEQVKLVQQAIDSERGLLQLAASSKKPNDATLAELLKPIADLIGKIQVGVMFIFVYFF